MGNLTSKTRGSASRRNGCQRLRRVDLSHQGSGRSTFDHITCLQTREPSNCAVELQRRTRRRPWASKCDQHVEAPARTARTVRARALISCVEVYSCRHCRARPVPCIRRWSNTSRKEGWGMRMTLLVYACECVSDMRVHDHRSSFALTGCAVCTCPCREDATCMRRYLRAGASAKDSSGALMRAQTQSMRCAHSHGRCVRL